MTVQEAARKAKDILGSGWVRVSYIENADGVSSDPFYRIEWPGYNPGAPKDRDSQVEAPTPEGCIERMQQKRADGTL